MAATRSSESNSDDSGPAVRAESYGGELAPKDAARTWSEALQRAAQRTDRGVWHVDGAGKSLFESYRDLYEDACRVANGLRKQGFKPGDRAVMAMQSSRFGLPAMWGCLLAGGTACLTPASQLFGRESSTQNSVDWSALAGASFRIFETDDDGDSDKRGVKQCFSLNELRRAAPAEPHVRSPDDFALVLFTSGSTGEPKAVPLRDRHLLAYGGGMAQANQFTRDDVVLNWLGLDHVGAVSMMQGLAIALGCTQVHVATPYVLEKVSRWLDLLREFRATVGWSPNFAYRLILDELASAPKQHFELAHVRYLINGGEQVQLSTVEAFEAVLAEDGLKPGVVRPCYGMSECCSAFTASNDLAHQRRQGGELVAEVGHPIAGASVRIVDEHNEIVKEEQPGRIEISGPSVFDGYLGDQGRDRFTADGWFVTGDVGYLKRGRLYITGRVRETIVVHGKHIAISAVEDAVCSLPVIDPAAVAACGVRRAEDDTDQIAIFFGTHRPVANRGAIAREIRQVVAEATGQIPRFLVQLAAEDFPRSGIGKVMRTRLQQEFQSGQWDAALWEDSQSHAGEERLNWSWAVENSSSSTTKVKDAAETLWVVAGKHQAVGPLVGQLRHDRRRVLTFGTEATCPADESAWRRFLSEEVCSKDRCQVVHVASLAKAETPGALVRDWLDSLLAIALGTRHLSEPLGLWLVTPVEPDARGLWIADAARCLMRSLEQEFSLRCRAAEIDDDPASLVRFARFAQSRSGAAEQETPDRLQATRWRRGMCSRVVIETVPARSASGSPLAAGTCELSVEATAIDEEAFRREARAAGRAVACRPRLVAGHVLRVGKEHEWLRPGQCVVAPWPGEVEASAAKVVVAANLIRSTEPGDSPEGALLQTLVAEAASQVVPPDKLAELYPRRAAFQSGKIDQDRGFPAHHLVSESRLSHAEQLIALGRNVGPVVVLHEPTTLGATECAWRSDGSYLILGGLGGVGKHLVKQLVEKKVGDIVIVGRRPLSDANDFMRSLHDCTTTLRYVQADITRRDEVQRVMRVVAEGEHALRGVFHLAGSLFNSNWDDRTAEKTQASMAAKIDGTWFLHEATAALNLDVFVLFSSLESVAPRPSLVGYALANAFLNGFARWRRQQGLPALAITWGAFQGTGMLSNDGEQAGHAGRPDLLLSEPSRILESIELLASSTAVVASACHTADVAGIQRNVAAVLNTIMGLDDKQGDRSVASLQSRSSAERRTALKGIVADALSEVIAHGTPADPGQRLIELGLDSIQSVVLLGSLSRVIGTRLPLGLLADCETIGDLIEGLINQLREQTRSE